MRDRLDEFGDAVVVVVTFGPPDRVLTYQREMLDPLTVLLDEDRSVYLAYGLGRGRVWKVWGPAVWWAYVRLLREGWRLQWPTGDTLQLGGDFVVDRHGRLVYVHRSDDPDDRPSVDELVSLARARP